jgi:hypothetical protein
MKRSRIQYLISSVVVICLGLASRRYADRLPQAVASYAGDTLWALTAFLLLGILFPRWTTLRVALAAMLLAVSVELSQFYRAPWIDHLRRTTAGALILGQGFLWSDLLCYAVGVGLGVVVEVSLYKKISRR